MATLHTREGFRTKKIGRGYLPELFRQIRTYLPELFRQIRTYLLEPVPANKNLFAGTCSGKLELICRNLSSRLTLSIDPRKGFFGQKKWPLGRLVFQFGGYNIHFLIWALELLDHCIIVFEKSWKAPHNITGYEELWVLGQHKRKAIKKCDFV